MDEQSKKGFNLTGRFRNIFQNGYSDILGVLLSICPDIRKYGELEANPFPPQGVNIEWHNNFCVIQFSVIMEVLPEAELFKFSQFLLDVRFEQELSEQYLLQTKERFNRNIIDSAQRYYPESVLDPVSSADFCFRKDGAVCFIANFR